MLGNAEYWAQFSTCVRRKVGAVIYNPDNWAVLSSGYNEVEAVRRFTGKGLAGFIQKPFTLAELSLGVEEALGRRH